MNLTCPFCCNLLIEGSFGFYDFRCISCFFYFAYCEVSGDIFSNFPIQNLSVILDFIQPNKVYLSVLGDLPITIDNSDYSLDFSSKQILFNQINILRTFQ